MSTYGYIKHNELSGYAIAHHGIKGQKWGIRRYQNPDGSLTEIGKKHYGIYGDGKIGNQLNSNKKSPYRISDEELIVGKKYYRGNGKYKVPNFVNTKEGKEKVRKSIESIIKHDAKRLSNGEMQTGYFDGKEFGIFNKNVNPIYHYRDKNGVIALSYSKIPIFGDVYVKGSGNINDIDLDKTFKKVPQKVRRMQSNYSAKDNYKTYGFFNEFKDRKSDFQKAEDAIMFGKSKGMPMKETYSLVKKQYNLTDKDLKELKSKYS